MPQLPQSAQDQFSLVLLFVVCETISLGSPVTAVQKQEKKRLFRTSKTHGLRRQQHSEVTIKVKIAPCTRLLSHTKEVQLLETALDQE